ncbi:asparagine synthase (glutamine-hydrolyzing) [Amylibacter sp.]|nr:asparagine synthase (glutamine-hydrolyzing) [Amylibacter sp.]
MCGISGFIGGNVSSGEDLNFIARLMADALSHRGPDGAGVWSDVVAGVALSHRRLSIVDLSAAGDQPMISRCGRYVLVFNGMIYNHSELRLKLKKFMKSCLNDDDISELWNGNSDTETLLECISFWGIEKTLRHTVGMFAAAVWDRQEKALSLMRDRFGEKPLYYGWIGQGASSSFVFGSELKALRGHPSFDAEISREALSQYMRIMYVPSPYSIYKDIYKLEPGCLIRIQGELPKVAPRVPLEPGASFGALKMHRWWGLGEVVKDAKEKPITDESEALFMLEKQLTETVKLQSFADVPLGAFLSGGVDSSAIVALMQEQSSHPVKTFTIGFSEAGFDEAPHASKVAQLLGTDHNEMMVSPEMARDAIVSMPNIYDEPFADSSQIPTYLVSQAASQEVKVALSGDAGDEVFGGYNRYYWGPRIWDRLAKIPYPMRQALSKIIATVPEKFCDVFSEIIGVVNLGDKVQKVSRGIHGANNIDDFYWNIIYETSGATALIDETNVIYKKSLVEDFLINGNYPFGAGTDANISAKLDAAEKMMFKDSITYLPDDILCKVDRAAMANSLETRVPFLDHRLVELAWRFPQDMRVRGNQSKWALRQLLYKHVPRELIERPKAGFAIPIGQWLRGPLRAWAEALLDEDRLKREGYFDATSVRQRWSEHLQGKKHDTSFLWAVLMFQAWHESVK